MSDQKFNSLVNFSLIDPHSLLSAYHISMLIIWLEQLGELWWSTFYNLWLYLLQTARWSARPEIKLVDIDHSKFVLVNQIQWTLEFLISLFSKSANDISGNSDAWTVLQEVFTNLSEIFNWVFSVHFGQYIIMAGLNWNVDEWIDSWMIEELSDCSKVFQYVWWVCHTNLD